MKRKLDVSALGGGGSGRHGAAESKDDDGGDSGINRWTNRPYSSRYYDILTKRKQLPVYEFKEQLEQVVMNNQVVIIEGETGSGEMDVVQNVLANVQEAIGGGLKNSFQLLGGVFVDLAKQVKVFFDRNQTDLKE